MRLPCPPPWLPYFLSALVALCASAPARALAVGPLSMPQVAGKAAARALDNQIGSYLEGRYRSRKGLQTVQPSVEDRVVTLNGTVPNYRDELEAIHQARQVASVNGVVSHLAINGPVVADSVLKQKISDRLTYDRIGMGQTFNALALGVDRGVVTVAGDAYDYASRDSALDIIADTPGVRGVVDDIKVAPASPFDDQIRLQASRRIYGNPALRRYAINPAHPIRILVTNGRLTLEGVVQSQLDKSIADHAARSIPNVFSVTDNLVVAGSGPR